MSLVKSLAPHLVLLGVAGAGAFVVATKDDKPAALVSRAQDVQVWGGKASSLVSIEFESDKLKLKLDAHSDTVGRWFTGSSEKTTEAPKVTADAGASVAPQPPKKEATVFVAVTQANKLADSLAPLMAVRAVGKIEDARGAEFGFDKPEGTLRVNLGGSTHALVFGGNTPGGDDRYVKLESGEVYAISGEISRSVLFADSRLTERELHEWKPEDVARARVTREGQTRELSRIEAKKDAWADPAAPDAQDETAGNWMSKVGRLRPSAYVEKPASEATLIVRIEYLKGSRSLGFVELYKVKADGDKFDYLVKSEQTRWFATALRSAGEQVEQDLGAVLK